MTLLQNLTIFRVSTYICVVFNLKFQSSLSTLFSYVYPLSSLMQGVSQRQHPILQELLRDIALKQPLNILQFIYKWSSSKLHSAPLQSSSEEQGVYTKPTLRMRKAIHLPPLDQPLSSFLLKDSLPKNQQCRSRMLLKLRSSPFFPILTWEQMTALVDRAEVREAYNDETIIHRHEVVLHYHVVMEGEVGHRRKTYAANCALLEQPLLYGTVANEQYRVVSEKAVLCSLSTRAMHSACVEAAASRAICLEKMCMCVGLFSTLDAEEINKVLWMIQDKTYEPNEVILAKGSTVDHLYFVLEGTVAKENRSILGEIIAFSTLEKGESFGQQFILTRFREAECSFVARSVCIVGTLAKEDFERGIQTFSTLKVRMIK